jgi:hypothetical protein
MNDSDEKPSEKVVYRGDLRCCQWIVLYGLLVVMLFMLVHERTRPGINHNRAKGTLRSTGMAQQAYMENSGNKVYGSFEALLDGQYIAEGYTLGNMIQHYSLTWEVYNLSTVAGEPGINRFTVIAYPRDTRLEFLNTFCVTDDQVVREYNPRNNEFEAIYHWDPIL